MDYFCNKTMEPYTQSEQQLIAGSSQIKVKRIQGFMVPEFYRQPKGLNEFSISNAAAIHDNAMMWLHKVHGTSEEWLRNKLAAEVPLVDSDRPKILVTSCGAGNDLPQLLSRYPNGLFYVQDIAHEMLEAAISRHIDILSPSQFHFSVGDACDLPFAESTFDIAYHFGGINLFKDVKIGVEEMHRVVKPGGAVLFGDEGIAPFLYNDEISKVLIKNNPLYACECPHTFIPPFVNNFKLQYLFNNCFYLVTYTKVDAHGIDIDVEHLGKRGGSLRTRYFGTLEGIAPDLRDFLYQQAADIGMSRVEYIQMILRRGLSQ